MHVKKNAESVFISSRHLHVLQSTRCAGPVCGMHTGQRRIRGVGALVLMKISPADIHVAYDCRGIIRTDINYSLSCGLQVSMTILS